MYTVEYGKVMWRDEMTLHVFGKGETCSPPAAVVERYEKQLKPVDKLSKVLTETFLKSLGNQVQTHDDNGPIGDQVPSVGEEDQNVGEEDQNVGEEDRHDELETPTEEEVVVETDQDGSVVEELEDRIVDQQSVRTTQMGGNGAQRRGRGQGRRRTNNNNTPKVEVET